MTVYTKKEILIVVKTYPRPSTKYQETVCVAGVLLEKPPTWIRLYPILFRDLPYDQQFKKFEVIQVEVMRNLSDVRPESHKVHAESIQVLREIGIEHNWEERKKYLLPLDQPSMCEIQRERDRSYKSLGIFKPLKVIDFAVEPDQENRTDSEKQILSQKNLFQQERAILEKIPYKFKIKYTCADSNCNGHLQTIIAWETAQLYRNLRRKYSGEVLIKKIKEKYLAELCGKDKDTYFIVGNQYDSPRSFLILGVFFPRLENHPQDTLPF